jgi:hypothetical protein
MSELKPSSHGIVVEHKESGVRYAVSDKNHNPDVARKVRDLRPGETVLGFSPLRRGSLGSLATTTPTPGGSGDQAETQVAKATDTQTEGSSAEGTKDTK